MRDLHKAAKIRGTMHPRFDEILTPEAMAFVAGLDGAFAGRRADLLAARREKARAINAGADLQFRSETEHIRADAGWQVAAPGPGLERRHCELVAPATRKMAVHALNSSADVWLADLEDATAPSWKNIIDGQINLYDAVRGTLSYRSSDGSEQTVSSPTPTIMMRPRGWHLCEKHISIDGRPISASFVDFGLYFFHNAQRLIDDGAGPYFYLPKIESREEAALWNDVFVFAQEALGIPRGTVRATVLIETVGAAFEMDEILYELREHSAGLNAGRWDYIFSYVRTFAHRGDEYVLPNRDQITMSTPFMRAYTDLLVDTCHQRGAHAIAGPAAVNPARQNEEQRHHALAIVRAEKEREAADGFDGCWAAHPAVIETCRQAYASVLGEAPDQRAARRAINASAHDLISLHGTVQTISLDGVRTNVSVALRYLAAWIGGRGAVAIDNLMEDAATVEISRAQLWQWIHHRSQLAEGPQVTRALVERIIDEQMASLTRGLDDRSAARYRAAREVLTEVALGERLPGFFTPYAYVRFLIDRPLRMSGPLQPDDLRQSEKVTDREAEAVNAA